MIGKSILSFIAIASITLSSIAQDKLITMDDLYKQRTFSPEGVWGLRSMKNGDFFTEIQRTKTAQSIVKYSYQTGDSVETIFSTEAISNLNKFSDYSFSADETKILLTTEVEPIYRHSTREHVWVYDLNTQKITQISGGGKQRYSTFSPDGKMVAYVRHNNLYMYDIEGEIETQITTDGEFNKIINGATDWVYEEEFAFDKAFIWSPDNQKIAFYRFDESAVKEFNMAMYKKQLYPTDYKFKYPKAGEDNSKVEIFMFNLGSKETVKANFPSTEYVPRIKWANADQLAVQTLNRHQSDLNIYFVDANTNESNRVYSEKSETYVDVINDWFFLNDQKRMIITSEDDGYNHIYSVTFDGRKKYQLTSGEWDVTELYGVSEGGMLYYQSAQKSPKQRHIYSLKLKNKKSVQLSSTDGWNSASFSTTMKYYINTHTDANTPSVVTINSNSGSVLQTLVDNKELVETLGQYAITKKEFIKIPTSYGEELNGWMIKPHNFDETKQYPVLFTIYGGPGSQTVKNSWDYNMMWHHMLAQKGYIVMSVDNRGTGARGAKFKKSTYQQLGKLEVEDYIETAKYLGSQSYIDSARIGIWGWSYGGYMSTLALSKGADYFKTAIAVAPVTNWRYYDNIYTERYMRTPQENADGYDNNSPINFVEKIKGNYLLVHGTADDNVHFQNTAELVSALVKADVQYDFYMYTDKNHGIYGGNTRKHLFTKFTNFLLEKL